MKSATTLHSGTLDSPPRELAHRAESGLEVRLVWHELGNRLTVLVRDGDCGEGLEFDVPAGTPPLEVFYHPYAYASRRNA